MSALPAVDWPTGRLNGRFMRSLPLLAQTEFVLKTPSSKDRAVFENCVYQKFNRSYGARVGQFMPNLVGMQDPQCRLAAVLGIRLAEAGPLFLEQYLAWPVEQEVGLLQQRRISRNSIIEIGNLAATWTGSSYLLFVFLAMLLERMGREWLVFTSTREVERLLHRTGFTAEVMAEARVEKLAGGASLWGSYYEHTPKVMVGSVAQAIALLHSDPNAAAISEYFSAMAEGISRELVCQG